MATAIIVLILVLLCIYAVKSYAKKLANGCCGGGDGPVKKEKVRDKDVSHYPYQITLKVNGMSCTNCSTRVENALNAMEGVWAKVDLKAGSALIRMKKQIPEEELRACIRKAGYSVGK